MSGYTLTLSNGLCPAQQGSYRRQGCWAQAWRVAAQVAPHLHCVSTEQVPFACPAPAPAPLPACLPARARPCIPDPCAGRLHVCCCHMCVCHTAAPPPPTFTLHTGTWRTLPSLPALDTAHWPRWSWVSPCLVWCPQVSVCSHVVGRIWGATSNTHWGREEKP